ncbi:UDP-glucuronosyl/UDP-glucosyltransferase [Macleaya cordata]|uniref:UDP-glucuronosyl/UDP-glucosyltransferase n=1 Tax=Macleaya cordata TaxID=56857 RepID=A0A200QM49_MACCD|nr:UDP-glucuronosyl/UDP-glucosyltransferase [Macleaya cordata]
MIVRDWAPQLEILAHASTGGFLSHCGWNSCMESLSMGVPIAAWPMHSDQPMNTMLVTEELKIGIVVREWANRDELVSSNVIESAVRKLGIGVRQALVSKDGSSRAALESFVAHISRS